LPVTLEQVLPWGRSFDEYVRMFDLRVFDLDSNVLDCAAGPASFNAAMRASALKVISCDPIYRFSEADIAKRIEETYPLILEKTRQSRANFLWNETKSPEYLGEIRMAAMKRFLADFSGGLAEGRYCVAELPFLPFPERQFDLALCSHFLFTYSDLLPLEFHVEAIRELCRVARETRIFPLLPNFGDGRSPHVDKVTGWLRTEGYRYEITRVPYEFQKGGNEMLRVSRP
jgi:hypothetical protein